MKSLRCIKTVGALGLMMSMLGAVEGQMLSPPGMSTVQSFSGQFIVFPARSGAVPSLLVRDLSSNTNYISLQPMLLAVSCERIKQKLWDQLGVAASWRGKVFLKLHPARSGNEMVTIVSEKSTGGWNYIVGLPDVLPRDRFLRAIVQVLLSEIANRRAGAAPAEIPSWLVEGFCRALRASSEMELFLPPPPINPVGLSTRRQMIHTRWSNPGEQARSELGSRQPLTFEQLSWPTPGQLAGEDDEIYQGSALIFVDAMLRLGDGQACLRDMLEILPRYRNWQLAFLQAFRAHFQTPLEVEKWWALQVVYGGKHGLFDRWTQDESFTRIKEIVHCRIEVRAGTNELPVQSEMTLQTVIREWTLEAQARELQRKLAELETLRPRLAPQAISLADEYRRVIQFYVEKRGLSGPPDRKRRGGPVSDQTSQATISQLNALDLQREVLAASAKASAP